MSKTSGGEVNDFAKRSASHHTLSMYLVCPAEAPVSVSNSTPRGQLTPLQSAGPSNYNGEAPTQ